jgi:phosphatidylglycerophosphate synthase
MTRHEIRARCKRQSDYIITLFVTNEISLFLTWLLAGTKATPNHISLSSMIFAGIAAVSYLFGNFPLGSLFLFLSHILDCTDGNLARAKNMVSPMGKWLDMFSDRLGDVMIFVGIGIYFYKSSETSIWVLITLIDAIVVSFYFYIVDIGLALGISRPVQNIGGMVCKGVKIKWGIMEPVIYGFILLSPFGFVKVQIVFVLILSVAGLFYQVVKRFAGITASSGSSN